MRAATCTPVDFVADKHFFGRDSGLLCRGFQAIGIPCVSVMPGTPRLEDSEDLLRTTRENLASASWWNSLNLDFVVLYAWGDPRYLPVAKAIREAGIRLIQSLDTAGLGSPYSDWDDWKSRIIGMAAVPQSIYSRLKLFAKAARDFAPSLYEVSRLEMINTSDLVTVVSPPALLSVQHYSVSLGFPSLARKIILAPHPVVPIMRYHGETKENLLIAVGRWEPKDFGQKDPAMLLSVIKRFLEAYPKWKSDIVGRGSCQLAEICQNWGEDLLSRLNFTPAISHEELAVKYCKARILLCPSRYESFHISSAEAVCCGCSIIVAEHPLLASTAWFTQHESGTLASARTPDGFFNALAIEVDAWSNGSRSPQAISGHWIEKLHSQRVACAIAKFEDQIDHT